MTQPPRDPVTGNIQLFKASPFSQPTDYILRYLAECRLRHAFSTLGQREPQQDAALMQNMARDIAIIKHVYVRDYL